MSYDACIPWAKSALQHRKNSLDALHERIAAWKTDVVDEVSRARTLESEFSHSTQAIVSSAICLDAFYDHIARYAPIDSSTRASWRTKKVARYSQVAETLRSTFNLKQNEFGLVRDYPKLVYKLRDAAVHPSNKPTPALPHPDLGISTDWRLVAFRGDVADGLVCSCLGLLWDLSHGSKYRNKELEPFIAGFRARLHELIPDGKPVPVYETVEVSFPN